MSLASGTTAVRPSRRPLRGLLRMRFVLGAIINSPHAEERPMGASRSTRGVDAALRGPGTCGNLGPESVSTQVMGCAKELRLPETIATRLYLPDRLAEGVAVALDAAQGH